jgi:uncharacterized protein YecE (DUF72 family)
VKNLKTHIGCSSFNTKDWSGLFYPEELPRSKWFDFYAANFKTYELNATFYKFPTVRTLTNWHKKTPEDFSFSVKAPKIITHLKKFKDCKTEIDSFYEIASEGLKEKLKCILFQLPPSFSYSEERLESIVSQLNKNYQNVVEFRNESWWNSKVFDSFKANTITFCSPNYPKLPTEIIQTNSIGYLRFHGNPKLFYSEYRLEELQEFWIQVKQKNFDEVYLYFNNTASSAGIKNAIEMKKIIS